MQPLRFDPGRYSPQFTGRNVGSTVGTTVGVAVTVGVRGTGVGVSGRPAVALLVEVGVMPNTTGVGVGIGVSVGFGVLVAVGTRVGLGVLVAFGVLVGLGVFVGVAVSVGVAVGLLVAVASIIAKAVAVALGVGVDGGVLVARTTPKAVAVATGVTLGEASALADAASCSSLPLNTSVTMPHPVAATIVMRAPAIKPVNRALRRPVILCPPPTSPGRRRKPAR